MQDIDSEQVQHGRDHQDDPLVMYLIVRETVTMGVGKTAAQCAHASQMLQLQYQKLCENYQSLKIHRDLFHNKFNIFEKWLSSSFRKVVLKADDKEWAKLKLEFKDSMVLVVDSGLTEIAPNTETVIGLWPMYKSQVPKVVQRLQALK
jgi:cytochrome c oxidase assembly factor 4